MLSVFISSTQSSAVANANEQKKKATQHIIERLTDALSNENEDV